MQQLTQFEQKHPNGLINKCQQKFSAQGLATQGPNPNDWCTESIAQKKAILLGFAKLTSLNAPKTLTDGT